MTDFEVWLENAPLPKPALDRISEFAHSFHTPQVMLLTEPEYGEWMASFSYRIDEWRVSIDVYEDGSLDWFIRNSDTDESDFGEITQNEPIPEKVLNLIGIEVLRLSEVDWKYLMEMLENPPEPNEALRRLMNETNSDR